MTIRTNRKTSFKVFRQHKKWKRTFFLVTAILLLAGTACTNNPMLVRVAYDRFPAHISSELSSFADFNQQQTDWIENASVHHHNWHRTTQLPRYVALLNNLAHQVKNDRTLNLTYFESLIKQSRELITDVNSCNPALFATEEMTKLSDQQVDQIRQNLHKRLTSNRDDYESNSRDKRSQKRFKRVRKVLSYASLNLNEIQKGLLRKTIDSQVSLGLRRFELIEQWNMEFVYLLQERLQAGFNEKVQSHIAKRWQLIESEEAEIWIDTHKNWRNFAAELMESLTDRQRKEFSTWISKMGRTLNTLAKEKIQTVKLPSPLSRACSAKTLT